MKLHYAGYDPHAEGFGWAVCNRALLSELSMFCEIVQPVDAEVIFMPIADHDLNPATDARAQVNIGYCFFEYELGPKAVQNAKRYDVILCGSTWCMKRLSERGIRNTRVMIQGVDGEIFRPMPWRKKDGAFRIFSGGKFEYRKGQDLVIAAFRDFARLNSSAHLVCAWHNPWPNIIQTMADTKVIRWDASGKNQVEFVESLLVNNGLHPSQFTVHSQLSQKQLAAVMANTDCGLFPNRCEGGTNLVLMEYASLGREIVANDLTGHADVMEAITNPIECHEDSRHWAVQNVEDIVSSLGVAHELCNQYPRLLPSWSWRTAAEIILQTAAQMIEAKSA